MQESANGSRDGSVPEELFQSLGELGLDGGFWPDAEDVRHWVAVRVNLGVVLLSNPIATGRAQAEAVVQLAVFENRGSTWFPLEGVLHVVDGGLRSSEAFHLSESFHDLRVENDKTARELTKVAAAVGTRLPVVDPSLKRFLREVRAVNTSSRSPDPDLLVNDFRVIEFVTRRNNHGDWAGFLKQNLATFRARNHVLDEIYQSVSAVLRAFLFPQGTRARGPDSRAASGWNGAHGSQGGPRPHSSACTATTSAPPGGTSITRGRTSNAGPCPSKRMGRRTHC
jgi:hypothetical protein